MRGCKVLTGALLACCADQSLARGLSLAGHSEAREALTPAPAQLDVLLRSQQQKKHSERLFRSAAAHRLSAVIQKGYDLNDVSLGWGGRSNWSDLWGPMWTCPLLQHDGILGDGGKWVCGVDQLLQREGCVVYSFGSQDDFSFEAEMLNRTVCDIHVFDPTVLPSDLRVREALLNGQQPRRRIWWHSTGISSEDNKLGSLRGACYGADTTLNSMRSPFGIPFWSPRAEPKVLWQPAAAVRSLLQDSALAPMAMDPADAAVVANFETLVDVIGHQEQDCADTPTGTVAPNVDAPAAGAAKGGRHVRPFDVAPHGDTATPCNMKKLETIMKEIGHTWIDVMKIDVEGAEFDVFEQVAQSRTPMPFTQMQIEVHHKLVDAPNRKILQLLHQLMSSSLRVFSLEPNIYFAGQTCMEFALMRVDACGSVVTPINPSA